MPKHGKRNDETGGNPILRIGRGNKDIDQSADRIARDIEIVDKGWKNTAEGKADLKSGRKPGQGKPGNGKHSK